VTGLGLPFSRGRQFILQLTGWERLEITRVDTVPQA